MNQDSFKMISSLVISKITSVLRFNGTFLFESESISSHSNVMSLLCINFAQLVPESDVGNMCYRCTIHDLEETITTDVPRPFKYANNDLRRLIDEVAMNLLAKEVDSELLSDVINAKNPEDINGFLVGVADRIQCFLKMTKEVEHYGNKSLKKDLESFKEAVFYLMSTIQSCELMSIQSRTNLVNYLKKLTSDYSSLL